MIKKKERVKKKDIQTERKTITSNRMKGECHGENGKRERGRKRIPKIEREIDRQTEIERKQIPQRDWFDRRVPWGRWKGRERIVQENNKDRKRERKNREGGRDKLRKRQR